jgi:RimJ/RimL family protein N-acetyltransferase
MLEIQDMDLAAARLSLDEFPRDFLAKNRQLLRLKLFDKRLRHQLVQAYLDFRPRNSFQGLPPLKDEVCLKWVEDMIATGINLLALSHQAGIVGHTALFPINDRKCEMLIVVWPRFQNIGIGTQLTRCVVRMARKLRFEKIWLPVDATNLRARHIYKKCGFEYASAKQSRELDMVCDLTRRSAEEEIEDVEPQKIQVPMPHFDITPPIVPTSVWF